MSSFILHSTDCTSFLSWVDGVSADELGDHGAGYVWTECPAPAIDHIIAPDGSGGYIVQTRTKSLNELKVAKLADLEAVAQPKLSIWEGGSAPSGGIQIDDQSQSDLNSWASKALRAIVSSTSFTLPYWIMADNSHRTFTDANEFLSFADSVGDYKTTVILNRRSLKDQIEAASDETSLNNIDINTGWPT